MLGNLALWVQFTQTGQTPAPWRQVASYGSPGSGGGTTVLSTFFYGTLAQPTAPMASPWVPVLDDACTWGAGTTDATSATTALTVHTMVVMSLTHLGHYRMGQKLFICKQCLAT